jgi:hypothetical protein
MAGQEKLVLPYVFLCAKNKNSNFSGKYEDFILATGFAAWYPNHRD